MKADLERLSVSQDNNSITLLDIVDFYPSVSFCMIEKAIWFFASILPKSEKWNLNASLILLKLGISHQILQFSRKYYEYKGVNADDLGLTISGYELAFYSNLVVAYLLAKLNKKLF